MEKLLRFLLYRGTTLLISRECTKVKLMIAISLEKLSGCLGLNKKFKKGKLNKFLNMRKNKNIINEFEIIIIFALFKYTSL